MTLSEMAEFFRKAVKVTTALIILLFVGKISWNIVSDYWAQTHAPPPTPPNYALGTNIPEVKIDLPRTSFNKAKILLETVDGRLPKVPNKLPIYQISRPTLNLLSLDRAQEMANSLGFKSSPETFSATEYQWKDQLSNRSLTLKSTDFSLHLIQENPNPKRIVNFSEKEAIEEVLSFLRSKNLLHQELKESTPTAKMIKISGSDFTTSFKEEANAVLVDILPRPIEEKYKFYSPYAGESLIRTVVTLQKQEELGRAVRNISELKYTFWKVDTEKQGTYPLKSSEMAWNEFQNNRSFISIGKEPFNEVEIIEITLGYYITEDYQQYLQPIYVFSGNVNRQGGVRQAFVSYLPAIHSISPIQK